MILICVNENNLFLQFFFVDVDIQSKVQFENLPSFVCFCGRENSDERTLFSVFAWEGQPRMSFYESLTFIIQSIKIDDKIIIIAVSLHICTMRNFNFKRLSLCVL